MKKLFLSLLMLNTFCLQMLGSDSFNKHKNKKKSAIENFQMSEAPTTPENNLSKEEKISDQIILSTLLLSHTPFATAPDITNDKKIISIRNIEPSNMDELKMSLEQQAAKR